MACIGPRWRGRYAALGAYSRSAAYGMRERPFRVRRHFSSWGLRWGAIMRAFSRWWIGKSRRCDVNRTHGKRQRGRRRVRVRTSVFNLRVALDDGVLFGGKVRIGSDPLAVRTQRRLVGRVRGLAQDRGGIILGQARQQSVVGAYHLLRGGVARVGQLFLCLPRFGVSHGDAIAPHAAVKEGAAKRQENALSGPLDSRIRAAVRVQ